MFWVWSNLFFHLPVPVAVVEGLGIICVVYHEELLVHSLLLAEESLVGVKLLALTTHVFLTVQQEIALFFGIFVHEEMNCLHVAEVVFKGLPCKTYLNFTIPPLLGFQM